MEIELIPAAAAPNHAGHNDDDDIMDVDMDDGVAKKNNENQNREPSSEDTASATKTGESKENESVDGFLTLPPNGSLGNAQDEVVDNQVTVAILIEKSDTKAVQESKSSFSRSSDENKSGSEEEENENKKDVKMSVKLINKLILIAENR